MHVLPRDNPGDCEASMLFDFRSYGRNAALTRFAFPTATSRTGIGIRRIARSSSTGTTLAIAIRTAALVWKFPKRILQAEESFCVMKFSQPFVILEISTICSLSRRYVRSLIIFNSHSVRIRCFNISTLSRNDSRVVCFWCLDLNAASMARLSISMLTVSIVP